MAPFVGNNRVVLAAMLTVLEPEKLRLILIEPAGFDAHSYSPVRCKVHIVPQIFDSEDVTADIGGLGHCSAGYPPLMLCSRSTAIKPRVPLILINSLI